MEDDKIIAHITTYPRRINTFKQTINSIIDQFDVIKVYLNEYDYIPKFLENKKIKVSLGRDCLGNLKAKGKFFDMCNSNGYVFTIDDDIIYPKDYVKTIVEYIDRFNKEKIITLHGKIINDNPKNYYRDYGVSIHFKKEIKNIINIHIPGTGVMAFHSSKISFDFDSILSGEYVDLFIGLQSQEKKYPIIIIPHKSNWVKANPKASGTDNLFFKNLRNHNTQTNLLKTIKWEINK